jgi:hypothetical protein
MMTAVLIVAVVYALSAVTMAVAFHNAPSIEHPDAISSRQGANVVHLGFFRRRKQAMLGLLLFAAL